MDVSANMSPSIWFQRILRPSRTSLLLFGLLTILSSFSITEFNPILAANLPSLLKVYAVPIAYLFSLLISIPGFTQTTDGFWSSTTITPLVWILLITIVLAVNYLIASIIANWFRWTNHEKIGLYFAVAIWLIGALWLAILLPKTNEVFQNEAQSNAACEQQATAEDRRTDLVGADGYCWTKCFAAVLPADEGIGDCQDQCSDDSKLYDTLYRHCMGEIHMSAVVSGTTITYLP